MITDQTVIEINLNSLKNNLSFIKSILRPKTMIMAVVKAHSYVGNSLIISKELEKQKIDYFAVEQLSNSVDMISYEILASLSKRISRKIIYSKLNT